MVHARTVAHKPCPRKLLEQDEPALLIVSAARRESGVTHLPDSGTLCLSSRRVLMPANLTPEYQKADLRYRQATSDEERLAALQEMLSAIPKHKGTDKMQADLKRRISILKRRHGLQRSRYKGPGGMRLWVGFGVIADNVIHIGDHLAATEKL